MNARATCNFDPEVHWRDIARSRPGSTIKTYDICYYTYLLLSLDDS